MAKPYSLDLRERVIAACDAGGRAENVGPTFGVSGRVVYKWLALRRETGSIAPRSGKTGPTPKLEAHRETLRELVEEDPDAALQELRDRLPIKVAVSTIHNALKVLRLSFKKEGQLRRRATAA